MSCLRSGSGPLTALALIAVVALGCDLVDGCTPERPTPSNYLKPPFTMTVLADGLQIRNEIPDCDGCPRWFGNLAFSIMTESYFTLDVQAEGPVSAVIETIPPGVNTIDLQDHNFSFVGTYQGGNLDGMVTFDESHDVEGWLCPHTLAGTAALHTDVPITPDAGGGFMNASFKATECLTATPEEHAFRVQFDWTAVLK